MVYSVGKGREGDRERDRQRRRGGREEALATSSEVRWGRELPLCYLIYGIKHKPTHKNKVPFAEKRFRGHSKKRNLQFHGYFLSG